MEGIAYQVEAPLSRTRDLMMEDRYRRLHYEAPPPPPQYWAQSPPKAVALARFKRHLPAIPKKKHKETDKKFDHFDMPAYAKHYKDKYGSVSAHSTSAIYGALRAPHYHAVYGPSNMWYASVRSLNRGCPREVMYSTDGYEWRDTLYEDVAKEVFAVPPPQVEVVPGLGCACLVRRRPGHEGSSHMKSRHQGSATRCKYCTAYPNNGSTNSGLLSKKQSINPEKMKAVEEKPEEKSESTSRMSGYKKCIPKFKSSVFKNSTKEKGSRKSILECDVTAYDLIKKVAKTPSISEIDDSDIDDNLSDNAVAKMNHARWLKLQNKSKLPCSGSSRQIANKKLASKFKKSQSENCIYSESHSVLVGGQRIFTDSHRSKSPDLNVVSSPEDVVDVNPDKSRWRKMSISDESICIPDPDYDYSDDSDDATVISCKYRDPKFTYSPPPSRKSNDSPHNGLSYGSREISKSMSSLLSEDTYVPSISVDKDESSAKMKSVDMPRDCDKFVDALYGESSHENDTYEECRFDSDHIPPVPNSKQDSKYESSSDCSSSGGTLSSEYPTWTSSSSNELKSILKKKRRRDNAIQELEDASRVFQNSKEAKDYQKKKQVQFLPGRNEAFFDSLSIQDSGGNIQDLEGSAQKNEKDLYVINGDIYETLSEAMSDKESINGGIVNEGFEALGGDPLPDYPSSPEEGVSPSSSLLPRSSSLEELPRRRFPDLHLLLCPARGCVCGSGDDPRPASTQRAPRSLPDSPSELAAFCFDFLEKPNKAPSSSRSVFYVPVDPEESTEVPETPESCNIYSKEKEKDSKAPPVVLPSVDNNVNHSIEKEDSQDFCDLDDNLSPDTYDTDEDILENDYENLDPIYEELSDVSNSSKRLTSLESNQKSFFEGASKIDILSYLEDAKERGISEGLLSEDEKTVIEEEDEDLKVLSGEEEDIGEKNRVIAKNNLNHKEVLLRIEEDAEKEENGETETIASDESKSCRIFEVERNDSGVGAETCKAPRLKPPSDWEEQLCADCDLPVEPLEDEQSGLLVSPLVCRKCDFRRSERKEIIVEFVDTELKYGRDLRIIKEEFCRPMEIAGLLAKEQLYSIFLNLDELTSANTKFSEKLQDALDIAMEHGDEDYTTVNLGKIFLESSSMLHAFETYCVKQASASLLLSSLEKEKELLRIFLRVSQMENTLLRRMNLPAFLMVPVQRVTRYPLLLSRLHKVTPIHHKDRSALKDAQQKVELHLEHINQQTKGVGGTKIWRRISNISASHRRLGKDIGSIKLRKMALEVLNWKQDETRFVIAGKLLFTQITDYPWNKKGKTIKFTPLHALLIALGKPNSNYRPESSSIENAVLFPRNTGIRDASLVLMKEKNGRFIAVREPLYLGNCVISCDSDCDDVFEVQEYTTKEAYLLKGENKKETKEWLRQLRYHAKDLGSWRKRRNALANIMINGMIRQ